MADYSLTCFAKFFDYTSTTFDYPSTKAPLSVKTREKGLLNVIRLHLQHALLQTLAKNSEVRRIVRDLWNIAN